MSLFDRIKNIVTPKVKVTEVNESPLINDRGETEAIPYQQTLSRYKQDVSKWVSALNTAESIHQPNRTELYRIFKETTLDNHLTALMTTRKNAILSSKYIVTDKSGKKIDEKTDMIEKKWFYDLLDMTLDSLFYGHSLIQFNDMLNGEFSTVELVPREYVRPEFDLVIPTTGAQVGVNYIEEPYFSWTISIGNRRDLGLLTKAAPIVMYKKGAMISWAIYSEIFGQPIRIGKLNKKDEKTYNSMVGFLKNMGNAPWGVFGKEDDIELLESGKASGQDVFDKMIDKMNQELSKLILGQTGTTDEKSFSGSAKVHERVMNSYNESDERMIEFVLNDKLIPLLNKHGYGMEGLKIEIQEDDILSIVEKSAIDIGLSKYYDLDIEYLNTTYGTKVIQKLPEPTKPKNDLDSYYGID
jgi:hypothetical protein